MPTKQKWLISQKADVIGLFIPVWITWLICFLLPESYLQKDLDIWVWVVLVLGIDVAHVWSTLYRSYLDPVDRKKHKNLLIWTPLIAFSFFFVLAWWDKGWFWTVLAYLAVYHFMKQQYGFMQIYRAKNKDFKKKPLSDKFILYFSMLYPVAYWHFGPARNFEWFISGDFFVINQLPEFLQIFLFDWGRYIYFIVLGIWTVNEIISVGKPNWAKLLWVLTTAGNWYLGIVYFNSDLAFTITNVVAHGVPYFILTFYFVNRREQMRESSSETTKDSTTRKWLPSGLRIAFMLVLIIILAFGEEYLWDMWIYRENEGFFAALFNYPYEMALEPITVAFFMGLLVVPQVSHYIFDGFIWKANEKNPDIKDILIN